MNDKRRISRWGFAFQMASVAMGWAGEAMADGEVTDEEIYELVARVLGSLLGTNVDSVALQEKLRELF